MLVRVASPAPGSKSTLPPKVPVSATPPLASAAGPPRETPSSPGPPIPRTQSRVPAVEYAATKTSPPPWDTSPEVALPGAKSAVPRNTPATTTSLPEVTRTASALSAAVPPPPKAQRTEPDGSKESTNPSGSLPLARTSPPVAGRASARPEKTPAAYTLPVASSARSSTSSTEVAPKRRAQTKLPSPPSFATNPSSAPALKSAGAPDPEPKFAVPSKPPPT